MKHLRRLLTSILRRLGLRVEHSINQNPSAGNEREPTNHETERPEQILRPIVDIPETVLEEYRANQKAQHRENRSARNIALAAVIGGWVYAGIAALQYCAMLATNRTAQTTLRVTERAYVNVQFVEPVEPLQLGSTREAAIHYENTGLTPAKDLFIQRVDNVATRDQTFQTLPILKSCDAAPRGEILPPKVPRTISANISKASPAFTQEPPIKFGPSQYAEIISGVKL
jgi:hypothetical protein